MAADDHGHLIAATVFWRPVLLAVLLLFAQAHQLAHGLDFDVHAPGEHCERCLHLSVFAHPLAAAPAVIPLDFAPPSAEAARELPALIPHPPADLRARGPPFLPSSS
jgi:hypothetical protein